MFQLSGQRGTWRQAKLFVGLQVSKPDLQLQHLHLLWVCIFLGLLELDLQLLQPLLVPKFGLCIIMIEVDSILLKWDLLVPDGVVYLSHITLSTISRCLLNLLAEITQFLIKFCLNTWGYSSTALLCGRESWWTGCKMGWETQRRLSRAGGLAIQTLLEKCTTIVIRWGSCFRFKSKQCGRTTLLWGCAP